MNQDCHVVKVNLGERSYEIMVQAGALEKLVQYMKPFISGKHCMIITDSNVSDLYGETMLNYVNANCDDVDMIEFPAGEESKHLQTVEELLSKCVEAGLDRSSMIIALGGGVVGDIAGFVAATYMRGIDFIQVPTTLLAMVDSSVGGKTGVDLKAGKNLVGAFWQPKQVIIDPDFLRTLPEREIYCGLAEVIKYGVIIDSELFALLEDNVDKLLNLDPDFYSEVITRCCRLKAHVVIEDERESGLRAILNYGHTFGHAIEMVSGYSTYQHGEGVAIGMCIAANLACELKLFEPMMAERQKKLLEALKLPVTVKGHNAEEIYQAMFSDKKTVGGKIKLILPEQIGRVAIKKDVDKQLVLNAIQSCCV